METIIATQLKSLLYDQKHFTARGLAKLQEWTKVDRHVLVGVIGLILTISLVHGEKSKYVANTLLVAIPFVLLVLFPDECPTKEHMMVYGGCYALLTLLDPGFEKDWDNYYLFKLLILMLLFLEPFNGADRILGVIEKLRTETAQEKTSKSRQINSKTKKPQTLSYENMSDPVNLAASNDVITSNVLDDSTKSTKLPNLNDLTFKPIDKLMINAPFMDNYSITLSNNSSRPIAVQLKSTCHDRIRIDPHVAVVKPHSTFGFTVKIKPGIDFGTTNVNKDRLAFDYVFCPPGAETFSHAFFQGDELRRRKNLPIQYNV